MGAGFPFSTYATGGSGGPTGRPARRHATIGIPLRWAEQIQRLELTKAELADALGRTPTEEELTEATGMTADERHSLEDVAG